MWELESSEGSSLHALSSNSDSLSVSQTSTSGLILSALVVSVFVEVFKQNESVRLW